VLTLRAHQYAKSRGGLADSFPKVDIAMCGEFESAAWPTSRLPGLHERVRKLRFFEPRQYVVHRLCAAGLLVIASMPRRRCANPLASLPQPSRDDSSPTFSKRWPQANSSGYDWHNWPHRPRIDPALVSVSGRHRSGSGTFLCQSCR